MMARMMGNVVVLLAAMAVARPAVAAVAEAEDLTGCKLPNGWATLPIAGSTQAENGALFKLDTNTFVLTPKDDAGAALNPDQTVEALRKSRAADVQYISQSRGSLWVFSGQVAEKGAGSLASYSGLNMPEAGMLPKTSRNYAAGVSAGVTEGFVYLLKTTEGKWALMRVLEKTDTALVVQYVLQPDGTTQFEIPRNKGISYKRPLTAEALATAPATQAAVALTPSVVAPTEPLAPAVPQVAPAAPPAVASTPGRVPLGPGDVVEPGRIVLVSGARPEAGIEPSMTTFSSQRASMIQRRLDIIVNPARTPEQMDKKAAAISELTTLHADEAVVAEVLVREIAFYSAKGTPTELSADAMHPAFVALKKLGKSGSTAALKALRALDLDGPGELTDSPVYKAQLLGRVVRSVEGDDVAEYLFRREAEKETDAKKKRVFELLIGNKP